MCFSGGQCCRPEADPTDLCISSPQDLVNRGVVFLPVLNGRSFIDTFMNDLPHRARYEALLTRVLDHIYNHLDQPLDIDRLAGIACLSPYHWHRIYQGVEGDAVETSVCRVR